MKCLQLLIFSSFLSFGVFGYNVVSFTVNVEDEQENHQTDDTLIAAHVVRSYILKNIFFLIMTFTKINLIEDLSSWCKKY